MPEIPIITEADIKYALERGDFHLHYQPILDLHSRQPVGLEALLRWMHPVRGVMYPE